MLVVVTGARVVLAPSLATPIGGLAAVTTTWIMIGRGNVAGRAGSALGTVRGSG
jgi:hypothetical protein